jgi:hypothetical protein
MKYGIQYIAEGKWVTVLSSFLTKEKAQETLPLLNDILFNANPASPLVMRIIEVTEEPKEVLHKRIMVL